MRLAAAGLAATMALGGPVDAQVETYDVGGDLSWASQALIQNAVADVGGSLQPLQLESGRTIGQVLAASGQVWVNGQPDDFTVPGAPRAWSNDGFFDQLGGPLALVDGDPATHSEGIFKTSRSQAGTTFYFDLGSPVPVDRIRFYPAAGDEDNYIRAFDILVSDGVTFTDAKQPVYERVVRVESNEDRLVDLRFDSFQARFIQLKVLSRRVFNLADFEVYGEGFVPGASYVSELHSFGRAVNFGSLRLRATRLRRGATGDGRAPRVLVELRSGTDDTPLAYFRRDRDTGATEEIDRTEYETDLPREALFRRDSATGLQEEVSRRDYLSLPEEEVGDARNFVRGGIRDDVRNWSPWTPPVEMDSTQGVAIPLDLPSPREFLQFRLTFDNGSASAMRIDEFVVEVSPGLVSEAVAEIALEADLGRDVREVAVTSGVDTTFVADIFARATGGQPGFSGLRLAAFPPPEFIALQAGDAAGSAAPVEVSLEPAADGFDVRFPAIPSGDSRLRLLFRLRPLEHNTPLRLWLLGDEGQPPHPVVPGDASAAVATASLNVYAREAVSQVDVDLASPVITPNGDGINERAEIRSILSQITGLVDVRIDVLDLTGRRLLGVVAQARTAGVYDDVWDARDAGGALVAPGLYLLRVRADFDDEPTETMRTVAVAY